MEQNPSDTKWQSGEMIGHYDLIKQLEYRVRSGKPLLNFNLANANLSHIDLVNHTADTGYQFKDANLYNANFTKAHCFKLDLSGSALMKANFSGANLHCANLENCNLLGTNFEGAKLENVAWGKRLLQHRLGDESKQSQEKHDYYQQAEEIYRHLRIVNEHQGLFEQAGVFFQREMAMRRMQMPKFSGQRLISKIVDLFCGYGEQPIRVINFTAIVIILFSLLYFVSGIQGANVDHQFNIKASFIENLQSWLSCLYFSVVTYTTLGYGDLAPINGISRLLAAIEAMIGSFTLALFVVVFVKKMTR